ncbi:CD48 antigen-like [Carassius carassius]|uniref:CD48 antigen-like n=1 Tax=Carassius carassius TaxID=217509 RepID=UPI0028693DD9|nr:CD48 antigen-like [Carassius carassius]
MQNTMLLLLFVLFVDGVSGAESNISVIEGDSVTLHTNLTQLLNDDTILWKYGDKGILLATVDAETKESSVYDAEERFSGRLELDPQTGSLTIRNSRTTDSGLYQLQIRGRESSQQFILTVNPLLPVPAISRDASQCSLSSEQNCSLVCSVVNVSDVSLSWFRGNSLLSSISVSDLSISLSLPLEVEYQDKYIYNCVINNSFTNQTSHLDIRGLCQPCCSSFSDHIHCCNPTEALIRLAVSALVGVAAVAVLVYDIRSRKAEQDTKDQTSPGALLGPF